MTWAAPRRPSRREVLVGGGFLAVAGCLGPPDRPPVDPFAAERRLRERVAQEVSDLSSAYDAVLVRFPEAADELATLAAEHAAHIAALRGPQPSASPAPSTASTRSSSPPASVPPTVAEARVALAAAERAASERRTRQAVTAPARTARLLASIAACEATHAALLERDA